MPTYTYAGSELELFAAAKNWKAYWQQLVRPFIRGDVLEVGAGIGSNTEGFAADRFHRWTCLEPDADLARRIPAGDGRRRILTGTLLDVPPPARFDVILYIDVLEHIRDDGAEARRAADHLAEDGCLIVLAPAHQSLYTDFDRSVGHYRRYTAVSLRATMPTDLTEEKLLYLDSVGMLASLGNRWVLRQAVPSAHQIAVWDRFMVRVSRIVDPLVRYRIGKSVLGVWHKVVC